MQTFQDLKKILKQVQKDGAQGLAPLKVAWMVFKYM